MSSFLLSSLKGTTPARYQEALHAFNSELRSAGLSLDTASEEQLDYMLVDHALTQPFEQHETTEGLGAAALTIAACARARPRHKYKTAYKVFDVWRGRCPPRQAPTFPPELASGCVTWLALAGRSEMAAGVLLCFCALFRAS